MCQMFDKLCLKLLKLREYNLKDKSKEKPKNKRNWLARPEGFESPTFGFEVHNSIPK